MIRIADPADLGPFLADLRAIHRLRRRHLADAAGMSPQQYGGYEMGRQPSVATLAQIADALGYDLALIPREDG